MLLTSSQVSAALSFAIVLVCTLALFISGVVLQRQSVKNLNVVLHPGGGRKGPWEKLVQRAEYSLEVNDPSKYMLEDIEEVINGGSGTDGIPMTEVDDLYTTPDEPDWSRRAYVQMVTTADEICNAVMGVTSLSIQGSKAKRVLVYPSAWDDPDAPKLDTERQLIEIAKREHMLETLTTGQIAYEGGDVTDSLLNQNFDKLLYLRPDGLIINATHLDKVFDVKMTEEVLFAGPTDGGAAALLQPRQSNPRKYEDEFGDSFPPNFEGLVETTSSVELSRSLNNAYSQGQLLGDIGYLHMQTAIARPDGQPVTDELRRSVRMVAAAETDSLTGLINEKYAIERATICGQYELV